MRELQANEEYQYDDDELEELEELEEGNMFEEMPSAEDDPMRYAEEYVEKNEAP